jgi:hypothetical protein
MSSKCLNVSSYLSTALIQLEALLLRKSWVISAFIFIKTLTHHNSFTQTFIFAQKVIFCKIKFLISSYHASLHEIAHQKVERLSLSSKIWWDDDLKFDEMTLSSSLMRWRFFRQVWWIVLVKFDEMLRQVWWVAFVKFDEMLRQVWRRIIDVARQIENKHTSFDNREWACVIRQEWD